jgi:hypothetical protein
MGVLYLFTIIIASMVNVRSAERATSAQLSFRRTNFVQHFAFESMQQSASSFSEDLISSSFLPVYFKVKIRSVIRFKKRKFIQESELHISLELNPS